jgi:bifunctional non-homologous end joining protein LigD
MSEKITLYYREGTSDKVYTCSIEPKGDGFIVPFAYGRRGASLTAGVKTKEPVPYDKAKKVYDSLVSEKMAKGYSPGEDGTPYVATPSEKRSTGINCQLLNFIEEKEVEGYLDNPKFIAQEKHDGKRLLLLRHPLAILAVNKSGLECGFPKTVQEDAEHVGHTFILDGELVGDTLYAFDLLEHNGEDLRAKPCYDRTMLMERAVAGLKNIVAVKTAKTASEKRALFASLKEGRREGIVFKDRSAPYKPGRPDKGGSQLKFKFWASATCRVLKASATKRSVSLELRDGKDWVGVGNCTIPPNHQIPEAGDMVEIKYLYAYKGGSLYQPIYLGKRDDVTEADCLMTQLKYKATDDEDNG